MPDLEDALRDLAAASGSGEAPFEHEPIGIPQAGRPETPNDTRAETPITVEHDPSEMSASALAQLSGTESAAYDPGMRSTSVRRKRRMQKPDVGMIGIRTASIPVLITMGLVMLALGVWGIMVRGGNDTLPMADQGNAQQLAIVGLIGLPVGILLFASAGLMLYVVGKDKQRLAKWEEMQDEDEASSRS